MVFGLTLIQHDALGRLLPGAWIPFIRHLHSHEATWLVRGRLETVAARMRGILTDPKTKLLLLRDDFDDATHCFRMHKISNILQHLSVMHVTLTEGPVLGGQQVTVRITSDSACVLPAWFPLSPLLGCLLCAVPFSDLGSNREYVEKLAVVMADQLGDAFSAPESVHAPPPAWSLSSISRGLSEHPFFPEIQRALFFALFILGPLLSVALLALLADSAGQKKS
ncbi:hypothetical protein B484DRAFT_422621 [Ochromonadaceae sp. CCMP2298]|nr:hypothetical protein B484DRAFT_422621 [Ochromonadaceae sp. CCMP2298]|mmetsp:Transcript_7725/g.16888  ORF Transcript_7725/g.16888 Transcript_7725/m.16888 type:complete len:223 (-) Transcript_7725:40-708(-)